MTYPTCDVVITTRDRPEAVQRCLAALADQEVLPTRIIVVDDGSNPPVSVVVDTRALGVDVEFVRNEASQGPAAGRNAGVAVATAEFIVFVDDDVAANRDFIKAHLTAVTEPHDASQPIVSCGPFVQPDDWDPTPWNLWEARQAKKEADGLVAGTIPLTWRAFHTGNNCVPRDVFVAIGGFNEEFKRSEDDELGVRLHRYGCQFRFVPDAKAFHYSHRSLESWLAIPRAYAAYDVEIDRRYPDEGYLTAKQDELRRRHPVLRAARWAMAGPRRSAVAVSAAVLAARAFHRCGLYTATMGALSVAYDLSYVSSMRTSLSRTAG